MAAAPRWGYHRLDSRAAAALVAGAGLCRGDLVLDVGAGNGALTAPLVAAGARVVAIELHEGRARSLQHAFAGQPVRVVRADAADLRLPRRPFRVVANPPFGAVQGLLRRLTAPGSRLVRADVVVPLHVARRWASNEAPGIARWSATFRAEMTTPLSPRSFRPAARGPVAVLVVERRDAAGRPRERRSVG